MRYQRKEKRGGRTARTYQNPYSLQQGAEAGHGEPTPLVNRHSQHQFNDESWVQPTKFDHLGQQQAKRRGTRAAEDLKRRVYIETFL
jgi:hypothetical protein